MEAETSGVSVQSQALKQDIAKRTLFLQAAAAFIAAGLAYVVFNLVLAPIRSAAPADLDWLSQSIDALTAIGPAGVAVWAWNACRTAAGQAAETLLAPFRHDVLTEVGPALNRVALTLHGENRPAVPLYAPRGSLTWEAMEAIEDFACAGAADTRKDKGLLALRSVETPFAWALLLGAAGAGKSRAAEEVARRLARADDPAKAAIRRRTFRREALPVLQRAPREDAWDCGFIDDTVRDVDKHDALKAWRPRRPTLLLFNDPNPNETASLVNMLATASPHFRAPVRLLVINQTVPADVKAKTAAQNPIRLGEGGGALRDAQELQAWLGPATVGAAALIDPQLLGRLRGADVGGVEALFQRTGGNILVLEVLIELLRADRRLSVADFQEPADILDRFAVQACERLKAAAGDDEMLKRLENAASIATLAGNPPRDALSDAMKGEGLGPIDQALGEAIMRAFAWSRHIHGWKAGALNPACPGFEPEMLADSITHKLFGAQAASSENDDLAAQRVRAAWRASPMGALRTFLRRAGETRAAREADGAARRYETPIGKAFRTMPDASHWSPDEKTALAREAVAAVLRGQLAAEAAASVVGLMDGPMLDAAVVALREALLRAGRRPRQWAPLAAALVERRAAVGGDAAAAHAEAAALLALTDPAAALALVETCPEAQMTALHAGLMDGLAAGGVYSGAAARLAAAFCARQDAVRAGRKPSRALALSRIRLLGAVFANGTADTGAIDPALEASLPALAAAVIEAWTGSGDGWDTPDLLTPFVAAARGGPGFGHAAVLALRPILDAAFGADGTRTRSWADATVALALCEGIAGEPFSRELANELAARVRACAAVEDPARIEIDLFQVTASVRYGGLDALERVEPRVRRAWIEDGVLTAERDRRLAAATTRARANLHASESSYQLDRGHHAAQAEQAALAATTPFPETLWLAREAAQAWRHAAYGHADRKSDAGGIAAEACAVGAQALADAHGQDAAVAREAAMAWRNAAFGHADRKSDAGGIAAEACAVRAQALADAHGQDAAVAREAAMAWRNAAFGHADRKSDAGGIAAEACAVRAQALADAHGQDAAVAREAAMAWRNAAYGHAQRKSDAGGIAADACAVRAQALTDAHGQDAAVAREAAMAWRNAAAAYLDARHLAGWADKARKALAPLEELARRHPDDAGIREHLTIVRQALEP